MVAEVVALGCAAAAALGEVVHAKRVQRVRFLAFGPGGVPAAWVRVASAVRVLGLLLFVWGCARLWECGDRAIAAPRSGERLLIALDVSPSMQLADAGPEGTQRRDHRASVVLRHLLAGVGDGCRTTILAFYGKALPVVVDAGDRDVVDNFLRGLPLGHAFVGQALGTSVIAGLAGAAQLAAGWPRGSTTLVLMTDGDAEEVGQVPLLPPSIRRTLVLGVGSRHGRLIGPQLEHSSAQQIGYLRSLAGRLAAGSYCDCNDALPPTGLLGLGGAIASVRSPGDDGRQLALAAVLAGGASLALLELLLRTRAARSCKAVAPILQPHGVRFTQPWSSSSSLSG